MMERVFRGCAFIGVVLGTANYVTGETVWGLAWTATAGAFAALYRVEILETKGCPCREGSGKHQPRSDEQ